MGAPADAGATIYDAALSRRQALMGASGARALVKNFRVFSLAAFACIGGVLYGYNQGMFSGVLAMPSFKQHMGEYDPFDSNASQTKKGWLTAILELGAWFGTLFSGFLAETISRKYGIIVACCIFILGVVVQACAIDAGPNAILAGRFITYALYKETSRLIYDCADLQFRSGSSGVKTANNLASEVRGALVALQQFAICFGIMVSFWIDYGTNYIGGTNVGEQSEAAWLVPVCLQLAPCLVLLGGMIFMPFSPRWLVHHNREDEAKEILSTLRGLPTNHELLQLEFLEIKAQSLFEKRSIAEQFPRLREQTVWNNFKLQFVAIKSLFQKKSMLKRCAISGVTMFFQQWTGINAVLYYAPTIFQQLGQTDNTVSLLATGVVGIAMLVATAPAVLWVDRIGRKPVLITGAIGMATCHIIIAILFARNSDSWPEHRAAGWAAVAMVWLFVVHFGYSWGPCAWIIIAEIWPLSSRPYGVSLGASSNWMNNFIIGQVTPDMLQGITYGTYILFGIITYLGAAFVYLFVPETKRLTLEEMDIIFGSEGIVRADFERMEEINNEIGLTAMVYRAPYEAATVEAEKAA
ncbi:quinate permease [Trichoderma cornu-damae]|uniref:Quinate permease n=1 Tax=Trichoderma cornu-damae TaxID=654480 RepID=A0A9P8QGL6_9HYPO|nr:quinate permease [Trichoderma cornu-damae]